MNRLLYLVILMPLAAALGRGADPAKPVTKSESFDRDPGWEGHNNRIVPARLPTVVQDFGYSKTSFAGREKGELGGRITRASEPAYYADKIGPVTLDEKLSASGTFALTKTEPGGGLFFGFFHAELLGNDLLYLFSDFLQFVACCHRNSSDRKVLIGND